MVNFTTKYKNPEYITKVLDKYGVAKICNYLSQELVDHLINEFQSSFNHKAQWLKQLNYSIGKGACVTRQEMNKAILPKTAEVFGSPFMAEVTDRYLGKPNLLNHEIYIVKDVVGSDHVAQDLHYDRIPTLKFFIYLKDTTFENGAFSCIPGTHTWTREKERKNRSKDIFPEQYKTRIIPEELATQAIPIEGYAGTLIIFHTDTLHHAGIVQKGERWVMRGHSRIPQQLNAANNIQCSAFTKAWRKLKEIQLLRK